MIYDLTPTWTTVSADLPALVETDDIHFQLIACEQLVLHAAAGLSSVQLSAGAARVIGVEVDGQSLSFTHANDTIVFAPLAAPARLRVFTGPPAFTHLHGVFPPGLAVDAAGVISGRVGDLAEAATFDFTMRIRNEAHVRDRAFTISASPTWFPAYYNPVTMLGSVTDAQTGFIYHPLGDRDRDAPLRLTLDVIDPDGVVAPVLVRSLRGLDPLVTDVFGTLPPGLAVENGAIAGYIEPEAPLGKYFFNILVADSQEATSYLFMIRVVAALDPTVEILPEIEWVTPAGLLGSVSEGRSTFLGVQATVIGGAPAIYTLSASSGPMPPGLRVDAASGLILGQIGPLPRSALFTFTVRATSELIFVERTFSIQVNAVFNARPLYDVRLRMLVLDKFELAQSYRDCLPDDALFRRPDAAYGLGNYDVYLLRGLDASGSLVDAVTAAPAGDVIGPPGYHHPIKLVLGEHRTAVARRDSGEVIYEVLYRPLYDPQALAGGFAFGSDTPVAAPVAYPQRDPQPTLYPPSLRNMRYDLVQKLGLATDDDRLRYLLGPAGVEGLPRWMTSAQAAGDPTSVIGFIPAVVIAFLNPGQSQRIINLIGKEKPLGFGKVYSFSRYIVAGGDPDHIQLG